MRGINFLAALGTIFIFIGIYCFKAALHKQIFKEDMEKVNYTPTKNYGKVYLFFLGAFVIILGVILILKSFKFF